MIRSPRPECEAWQSSLSRMRQRRACYLVFATVSMACRVLSGSCPYNLALCRETSSLNFFPLLL